MSEQQKSERVNGSSENSETLRRAQGDKGRIRGFRGSSEMLQIQRIQKKKGQGSTNSRRLIFIVQFLGRNSMDISRKFTEGEFLEMNFLACVIDVDAYQIAFGIIIEHNTLRDFFAVNTRFFGEIDVK